MPADHALKSLKTVAAKGPLCMTEEDWKQSHTTPHSPHGSPADIIASTTFNEGNEGNEPFGEKSVESTVIAPFHVSGHFDGIIFT